MQGKSMDAERLGLTVKKKNFGHLSTCDDLKGLSSSKFLGARSVGDGVPEEKSDVLASSNDKKSSVDTLTMSTGRYFAKHTQIFPDDPSNLIDFSNKSEVTRMFPS